MGEGVRSNQAGVELGKVSGRRTARMVSDRRAGRKAPLLAAPGSPAVTQLFGSKPLQFLVGATAVGKTAIALDLARLGGFEIVSMDSMLVYRGMDVGTAKPDAAERAAVPHHGIDLVEPVERYDVQRYLTDAASALADVEARGKRALFVGGTGFYLKALAHGLFEGPPADLELRGRLEARWAEEGAQALHAELSRVDPTLAERLHPNDRKRVLRGLEVHAQTGRPLSVHQAEWTRPLPAHTIVGLTRPRAELDRRIDERVTAMLDAGWLDEVRRIEAGSGFGPTSAAALGYPEVRAHLRGELERADLAPTIAQRTRRFARKQLTWLRSFPVQWHEANVVDGASLRAAFEV